MFSSDGDMLGCNLVASYHITDGGYVDAMFDQDERRAGLKATGKLAGATMVVVSRPKELHDRDLAAKGAHPHTIAVYIPKNLAKRQQDNLKFVLVEHQSRFAWANLDFRLAQITFRQLKDGYSVEIPGVLKAQTLAILGAENKPMTVEGVTFQEGERWTLGKTSANTYTDPSEKTWHWDYAHRNGAWCKFSWDHIDHP